MSNSVSQRIVLRQCFAHHYSSPVCLPNPFTLPSPVTILRFLRLGEFMKVLLRNIANGWYYQGPGKWTPRQQEALDLGQSAWAVELVFQEHLENVEILLCYDDPRHNVVLPVERPQQEIAGRESDLSAEPFPPSEESSEEQAKKKPPL